MGKGWSVLFGGVLFASFMIWPASVVFGWWLPENIGTFGGVDDLFYMIFAFVAFFFVLTGVVQVYAMWTYAERPGEKAVYTHGNHYLEIFWTVIPAGILLLIAGAQVSVWARIKYQKLMPTPDLTISVMARQWEWRMRYPVDTARFHYDNDNPADKRAKQLAARAWAENPAYDDLHLPNEIHCYKGAKVKLFIRTQDVLHSFTIPNLRIKQDTVPGKTIPMWFEATRDNCYFDPNAKDASGRQSPGLVESSNKLDHWEIACQELCGGRHYAMRGRLYVHRDKASYEAWLKHARENQETRVVEAPKGN